MRESNSSFESGFSFFFSSKATLIARRAFLAEELTSASSSLSKEISGTSPFKLPISPRAIAAEDTGERIIVAL